MPVLFELVEYILIKGEKRFFPEIHDEGKSVYIGYTIDVQLEEFGEKGHRKIIDAEKTHIFQSG